MLTPKKHLDLDSSVIRVAALILSELQRRSVVQLEKLRAYIIRRVGEDGEIAFLPSINFLYLVGKVAYHPQNDTIEFLSS